MFGVVMVSGKTNKPTNQQYPENMCLIAIMTWIEEIMALLVPCAAKTFWSTIPLLMDRAAGDVHLFLTEVEWRLKSGIAATHPAKLLEFLWH